MSSTPRFLTSWSTPTAVRVAQVTATFWLSKGLSTALGESLSNYLVSAIRPVVAVLLGFMGFVVALAIQLTRGRYRPWSYWLARTLAGFVFASCEIASVTAKRVVGV